AACSKPISALALAPGATSADFYFADSTLGAPTVSWSPAGLSPGSQLESVGDAVGSMSFSSAAQTISAGGCTGAVSVQTFDLAGAAATQSAALTVALSSNSGTMSFFGAAGC